MPALRDGQQRVLILGGTAEAAELAVCLADDNRFEVTTSLAGVTRRPAALAGAVRRGGFGGTEGMAAYIREAGIARIIDATHPFATTISAHAAEACRATGVPLLRLERPPWQAMAGDRWIDVASMTKAATALPQSSRRVFLSSGRKELKPFGDRPDLWFLIRLIEAPAATLPLVHHKLILARGPFDTASETVLFREHGIDCLVAKNSGGGATYGKIAAARALELPVVMVRRPDAAPAAESVRDVCAALRWLER